ncbi:MAG TPA: efflux RND transporter permease subunit [Devosiaceae bacterium]|nr:efflux RND transporter permease subunit [Devosiaceae bacterium]
MMRFNLSEWALQHRSFVWFLMALAVIAGIFSYQRLGREEDPSFDIKTMVIQAYWPGASLNDTMEQVTQRIERAVQNLDTLDYSRSQTVPGEATIFVNLKDSVRGRAVSDSWYQVRKKVNDILYQFPQGIQGPYYNDEFGTVYGNIYAFTSDGLSYRQLRDYVEQARDEILTIPNVGKADPIGTQDEVIFINFSTEKLATLGISTQQVIDQLQAQNAVTPAGVIESGAEQVQVRVGGQFTSEEDLKKVNLKQGDNFFRLADVATITRGYKDPPDPLFRFDGQPALGLGISMTANGNVLEFGKALEAKMTEIESRLPVGVGVHLVSDQPQVVREAVGGFTSSLFEAVLIVLVVSFLSLGLRAGFVVALSIPIVLAVVFVFMDATNISLQRVSLGALIIALGLLVDDAMITVEMMVSRLEAGDKLHNAATFAFTSTAFPMLTGTLVTVAGFTPIVLNQSTAGEYVASLFWVIFAALIISWFVAVLFSPLIGVQLLPKTLKRLEEKPRRFAKWFVRTLVMALRHRWITIGITLALFAASIVGLGFVQQQFFPASDRPEILIDVTLPQDANIRATQRRMDQIEASLKGDDDIERWSSYVGEGAVRFYLPLDSQLANPYFAQAVVVTKDLDARARVKAKLDALLADQFSDIDTFVHFLDLGPPVGRPVQYRISGPDIQKVRGYALQVASLVDDNSHIGSINFDWNEPGKSIQIDIQQDKAQQLGVTSQSVAQVLNTVVNGATITQVRDSIYLVDVIARAESEQRNSVETLQNLQVATASGVPVPLASFANIRYGLEQPTVWRRDRQPTITVQATVNDTTQPATINKQLAPAINAFSAKLPAGYQVAVGGSEESSAKSQNALAATLPIMVLLIVVILMVQLQSIGRLLLVLSIAPLGLIGVVAALLPTGKPLGFVAILGVLALGGILIRNSVILISQIDAFRARGDDPWHAVIDATEHRMRPILLTASAASLGMIPIAREVFWGPMAYAMIGGIIFATVLTLFFLPALYVAAYRIKPSPDTPEASVFPPEAIPETVASES